MIPVSITITRYLPNYDSMISKLVVWGENRKEAINRMRRALYEYIILGPKTNIPYLSAVMENDVFRSGWYNTKFVEEEKNVFEVAKKLYKQQFVKQENKIETSEEGNYYDYCNEAWVYGGIDS